MLPTATTMDIWNLPRRLLNIWIVLVASMLSRVLKDTPSTSFLKNASTFVKSDPSSIVKIEARPAKLSRTIISQIVAPQFCDQRGIAYGGAVMSWVDITAGIAAKKHSDLLVVTASLDSVAFAAPLCEGEIVNVRASVNRSWKTSMEVGVRVEAENPISNVKRFCCHAYLTFVGLKSLGEPTQVPPVTPETDSERRRFEEADARRNKRYARRKEAPPIEPIKIRRSDMTIDTPSSSSRRSSIYNGETSRPTGKVVCESYSETSRIVFPGHANSAQVLFGGQMVLYMEQVGAIAASRHAESLVVTASIDSLNFIRSAQIGDVLTIRAIVTAAFTHSVEVYVTCETESGITNDGYLTLVAVDGNGGLVKVPELICESEEEKVRHSNAWKRRAQRLEARAALR
ncbi:hypothetical protein SeMB42_g03647 [Synchytrium endobioticum]|uniref:HotDog ACOT-type domain-containing protein n=1 Tax=Synchytrium endobioticum TaxID=286115 RepID=A0A507D4Y4_9FUNG|nr:hypothetical protein SeMB42_g03647 [Synchytrium endobioticum]